MCPTIPFYIRIRSGRLHFYKKSQNRCTLVGGGVSAPCVMYEASSPTSYVSALTLYNPRCV